MKKKSKDDYLTKRFDQLKGNMKNTWKLIGTLIKRKTKGQTIIPNLKRNNQVFTEQKEIINQFNEHFINVGPNLA